MNIVNRNAPRRGPLCRNDCTDNGVATSVIKVILLCVVAAWSFSEVKVFYINIYNLLLLMVIAIARQTTHNSHLCTHAGNAYSYDTMQCLMITVGVVVGTD